MAFSNSPQYSTYQQKSVPFYAEPLLRNGTTTKDQRFYNCFVESYRTPNTDTRTFYVRKRFGTQLLLNTSPGEIRGFLSYENIIYWVAGNTLYTYDGVNETALGVLGTSTGPVGMKAYFYNGTDQNYILVADGTTLYNYNIDVPGFSANPAGYPTPHSPYIEVMDGYILMVKSGSSDMYNSQLSDWSLTWDFLSAEMYPDKLLGLQRFNNYIMAIGTETMEMFYDAANEDGSPFSRNDSVIATIGCRAVGSAIQTDRKFMWLGSTQEGDASVWSMEEFKPVEIATADVKMALSRETNLENTIAYVARIQGHQFYIMRLENSTWMYDVYEKIWTQLTWLGGNWPFLYGGEYTPGRFYALKEGTLVWLNDHTYTDFGAPIDCTWQTEGMTFDTMNRKFLNRMTIVGDQTDDPSTLLIQWSDTDFKTFNTGRSVNLNAFRPALVNLGYFRKRAFKFTMTSNTPMRLESMELNYNVGVN